MAKTEAKENVVPIKQKIRVEISTNDCEAIKRVAIDNYTSAGFSLFACRANSKEPPKNSLAVNTPFDPLVAGEDFPDNYGVILRNEDLVIDDDPRAYAVRKGGYLVRSDDHKRFTGVWKSYPDELYDSLEEGATDKPLERFLRDAGLNKKIKTYIVRTGGGGHHIHFKIDEDFRVASRLANYPGLEFKRGPGLYLIGPGSIHPDTQKPYIVKRGDAQSILPVSAEMLSILRASDYARDAGLDTYEDTDEAIRVVTQYMKTIDPAVQGDFGDEHTVRVATFGHDWGLPPETTLDLMLEHFNPRCLPPWNTAKLEVKVRSAYNSAKDKPGNRNPLRDFKDLEIATDGVVLTPDEASCTHWNFNKDGKLTPSDVGNLMTFFCDPDMRKDVKGKTERSPNPLFRLFRYNKLHEDIEYSRPAPWHKDGRVPSQLDQREIAQLIGWLSHNFHYQTTEGPLFTALLAVSSYYAYNPIEDYLNTLEWDGVERLDGILTRYAGAKDNELNRAIGRCFMIAAVARALQPGCKYDTVLVLEGPEGIKKSTFVKTLGGPWGRTLSINLHDRERTIQSMMRGWILETPDLAFTKRHEYNDIKSFITNEVDTTRLSYGRKAGEYPRRSVIVGTFNPTKEGYLVKETGNRRYWPVPVTRIDIKKLERDRDQLFAEAMAAYKKGELWWIENQPKLEAQLLQRQKSREIGHPLTDEIRDLMFRRDEEGEWSFPEKPKIHWLMKQIGLAPSAPSRRMITRSMEELGWEYKASKIGSYFVNSDIEAVLEDLL